MRPKSLRAAGLLTAVLASAPLAAASPAGSGDFIDVLEQSGQFTTLLAAIDAAGLTDEFETQGPATVFAPTDTAFANLPAGAVEALVTQPNLLATVLKYHVVQGEFFAADVISLPSAQTLTGEKVKFNVTPTGGVQVNKANVTTPDVVATNGVAHVIDRVLIPDLSEFAAIRLDLVQLVSLLNVKFDDFNTLLTAVVAADLAGALSAPGDLTLFAPTDRAFARLPDGLLESLLANPADLAAVLTYHVVPQELFAADVVGLSGATTLQGQDVSFSVDLSGGVFVNTSQVVVTDLNAKNGVMHVIDEVLIPDLGS
ncbi:MAG: fasciclin domain-containing protein [Planctomycetota bacterium]